MVMRELKAVKPTGLQAALPITIDQCSFLTPREAAINETDESFQEAKEKIKVAMKCARSGTQRCGKAAASEKSLDLRDVEQVAGEPLTPSENDAGDVGGATKQEGSPESHDAAPRLEDNDGSGDSRGEGNADRPSAIQDEAGKSRELAGTQRDVATPPHQIAMLRRQCPRSEPEKIQNLALSALLKSVHLSNNGLRLYENESDERTIRKAQSHLQIQGFFTNIGLAKITRLFRDVKLAREYLQLWEARPFSVVSMKEWFLVELRDWKTRGGSISGQGGTAGNFEDNFFPARPLIAVSGGDVVPTEPMRMANNPHWEPRHSTSRGMDRPRVE